MWTEVKIHFPEKGLERIFPAARGGTHAMDGRQLTARLNDDAGKPLSNEFFHYDELQRPKAGRPGVRFGSFQGGISVIGVGRDGVDLVESQAHKLRRLWADHLGVALMETRHSGDNRIAFSMRPQIYSIHGLAFEMPVWEFDRDNWFSLCKDHLAEVIVKGLAEQLKWNHVGDFNVIGDGLSPELEGLKADVLEAERLVMRRLNPAASNTKASILVARNIKFSMPLQLDGIWHVGRLPARGFGKIREVRGFRAMERSNAVRE